ncbi:MAG: phosphoethanolamine transferase CptA [Gammaproteobacteria bacterium]|nr:MAG: phosphoethanolamine transferase CptA [Gammaproteobacteria bacterium]
MDRATERGGGGWRSLLAYYLFFAYFSVVEQAIIYASGIADFFGVAQSLLMSLLWLVPVLLLPRHGRTIAGIIGLVVWLTSLVSLGYLAIYHQEFSQGVIFTLFESNWAESSEYLESYFAWWMLPALAVYSLVPWLMWRRLRGLQMRPTPRLILAIGLLVAVFWPGLGPWALKGAPPELALRIQADHMEPVAPWQLVIGYAKYRDALQATENRLLSQAGHRTLPGLIDRNRDTANTLVLVIGESTNSRRMGLYGYWRNTTPRLSALAPELLVFDQVYAARPYTIESLEQVLSFADQRHPKRYLESPTLIEIMKQAGYRTYWITNQQTQTRRNTLLTTFSKQADEQIYLNNNRSQNSARYDEVVFRPFEDILHNEVPKKFILVHLIGTHRAYRYRYPDSFNVFEGRPDTPRWLHKARQRREYNDYDNAVRYNDFVVAGLIQRLKESGANGFLVYFADHGEEVYDFPGRPFAGRNEKAPTLPMYSVPFLIWRSESWKRRNPVAVPERMVRRLYSLSDFIFTWLDLAGIGFDGFDPGRSIVNPRYRPHPVLIGNPEAPETLIDLRQQFQAAARRAGAGAKAVAPLK